MTFFLHIDSLQKGLNAAEPIISSNIDPKSKLTQQQIKIINTLNDMKEFAERNLNELLSILGFESVESLNNALQNYNNLNLSLQQIFPAFSAPQMSEVFQRVGISKIGGEDADYGLIISAFEDSIKQKYSKYVQDQYFEEDIQGQLHEFLSDPNVQQEIGADMMARLFGGFSSLEGTISFEGSNFIQSMSKLTTQITKAAKERGVSGTTLRTLLPFYTKVLQPFFNKISSNQKMNIFINNDSYGVLEDALKEITKNGDFNREIIKERIKRGGVTVSTKIKSNVKTSDNTMVVDSYIDSLKVGINPEIFNLSDRKGQTIEEYVNNICKKNDAVRRQIIQNIKNFYWNIILSYMPITAKNALLNAGFKKEDFDILIDNMVRKQGGSIGWFFSQGMTKELGAGMFGEIASMIYMSLLCPNLVKNKGLDWAGGVIQNGAKPPADLIISQEMQSYGIQVKNYSSGSTLEHEYNLNFKNILDTIDEEQKIANIGDSGFMQSQILYEFEKIGITQAEIEQVQNIIIANTFNVPYRERNGKFELASISEVPQFQAIRNQLSNLYNKATHYMALISLIMHRVQYAEIINRQVDVNKKIVENQLQNTLWLINGKLFVSSVQILDNLLKAVKNELQDFFDVTARVKYFEKEIDKDGKEKTTSHNLTIVEFFNLNASEIGKTSLSKISATIGTKYRTSSI